MSLSESVYTLCAAFHLQSEQAQACDHSANCQKTLIHTTLNAE